MKIGVQKRSEGGTFCMQLSGVLNNTIQRNLLPLPDDIPTEWRNDCFRWIAKK